MHDSCKEFKYFTCSSMSMLGMQYMCSIRSRQFACGKLIECCIRTGSNSPGILSTLILLLVNFSSWGVGIGMGIEV